MALKLDASKEMGSATQLATLEGEGTFFNSAPAAQVSAPVPTSVISAGFKV